MSLLEHLAELCCDQRREADLLPAEEAAGEFGVEQDCRAQADLGEAGEILGRRVEDPLDAFGRCLDDGEIGEVNRVDECDARALAAELHEVGTLAVLVARRPFGIEGQRASSGGESLRIRLELGEGRDDVRHPVSWLKGRPLRKRWLEIDLREGTLIQ